MMTLNDLLELIKNDHETLMIGAHQQMVAKKCFKSYTFQYKSRSYDILFNLMTLDFIAQSKMPVSLRSKLKSRIIEEEYLKWKFKKEGRAFFDFLRLNYGDFGDIVFTDCESPDFIIHNGKHHGYEVTEATDAHNAKFNETVYLLTGMDTDTHDYHVYLKQIEKSLRNKRSKDHSFQPRHLQAIEKIQEKILECILKKTEKYKEYEADLDSRNIIVFNNRIGFRRQSDFDKICQDIKKNNTISSSNIDSIFIISGTHDVMVELNKYGDLIQVKRK